MIYESLILVLNACSINVCSIKTITDDNGVLSFLQYVNNNNKWQNNSTTRNMGQCPT